MRIAGWVLLVAGFILCVSIVWAALGFLWMGVGLIALQAAAARQRRAVTITRARRNISQPDTAKLESDVKSLLSASKRSVADGGLDLRQVILRGALEFATAPSDTNFLADLAKQVANSSAVQKAYTLGPALELDDLSTVASADHDPTVVDDGLIKMMSKFAPDSASRRKS